LKRIEETDERPWCGARSSSFLGEGREGREEEGGEERRAKVREKSPDGAGKGKEGRRRERESQI